MDPSAVLDFLNTWGVLGGLVLFIVALQRRGIYTKAQVEDMQAGYERRISILEAAQEAHLAEVRSRFNDAIAERTYWRDIALRALNISEEAIRTDGEKR